MTTPINTISSVTNLPECFFCTSFIALDELEKHLESIKKKILDKGYKVLYPLSIYKLEFWPDLILEIEKVEE